MAVGEVTSRTGRAANRENNSSRVGRSSERRTCSSAYSDNDWPASAARDFKSR